MALNTDKSFLGRGWGFPPTFNKDGLKGVEMVERELDIKQSLEILLGTQLGERVMLPDYGCNLFPHLFDSITASKVHYLSEMIRSAILQYEPRIVLNEVIIDDSQYLEGVIRVNLDYSIETSNTRFNLVFPYYKVEGTDIPRLFQDQVTYKKQAQ